jgi:stearoyl-CoA desaturase (delta-9 desaturase)
MALRKHLRNGRSLSFAEIYLNVKTIPFWLIHLAAIVGVAVIGPSWAGVGLALAIYVPGMFFVTGAYHRYFSHRTYRTSRVFQFLLAWGAQSTAQKGVLWWATHHRKHHKNSDSPADVHSPRDGFWWSHMGWILSFEQEHADPNAVKDLSKYPELRFLNRFYLLPAIVLQVGLYLAAGWFGLVWGMVAQVLLWHGTFTINSLSHVIGTRRFQTTDDSRNHWALALITLGEGWHNNHHHRPGVTRQGLMWWEIDITYYILRGLAALGLIWDLHAPPKDKEKAAAPAEETPLPLVPGTFTGSARTLSSQNESAV